MRKLTSIIKTIFLVSSVLAIIFIPADKKTDYFRSAAVVEIKNNIVTLEDTEGNLWCVDNDKNYQLYQRYILVMNDNGTEEDITDDVILGTK